MLTTLLGVGLSIVLAFLLFSLAARALCRRALLPRMIGVVLSGLLGLMFAAVAVVAMIGVWRLDAPRTRTAPDLQVAGTPEQIARGEQLAWLCAECHASAGELPLNGGRQNFLAGGPPLGELYAPNLTAGGDLKSWSDGEIVRAIREGLDAQGVPLLVMPAQAYRALSDEDVQSLVAYLRSQPALRHDQRPRNANLVAALILGGRLLPTAEQAPIGAAVSAPPRGPSGDYGRYLVTIAACADCHGAALDGVPANQFAPRGPSLRATGATYSADQFVSLFRMGQTAAGPPAAPTMPWKFVGNALSDDDLRAMYAYLSGLE